MAQLKGTSAMSKGTSATKTRSVQDAIKNLTRFVRQLDTVPTAELMKSAETMKAEMVAQAPYSSGKPERSIRVQVSKSKTRPGIRASASVRSPGGYNYAGIQHENESFQHPVKDKAHYISAPFNSEVGKLKVRLRKELKVTHDS